MGLEYKCKLVITTQKRDKDTRFFFFTWKAKSGKKPRGGEKL